MKPLLAIDWGTSSLRGALLAEDGSVLQETSAARGILTVPAGDFRQVFDETFGAWFDQARLALICGMAGSRQGWVEAPYARCPAGLAELAASLAWIEPGRIGIVPGLTCEHDGTPDVMRGEETQVFGALQLLGLRDAQLVLPGTHSKWVHATGGRVDSFTTFMTGEVYALLRRQSILARGMPEDDGELNEDAFEQGLQQARRSTGLLQTAFSARTLGLFDRLPAHALPSYLSGLVIGDELRAQGAALAPEVVIMANAALAQRYAIALKAWGVRSVRTLGSEASWQGLRMVAQALG